MNTFQEKVDRLATHRRGVRADISTGWYKVKKKARPMHLCIPRHPVTAKAFVSLEIRFSVSLTLTKCRATAVVDMYTTSRR